MQATRSVRIASVDTASDWRREFKEWEEGLKPISAALDILLAVPKGGRLEFYDDGSIQQSVGSTEDISRGLQSLTRNIKSYTSGAKISGDDAANYVQTHIKKTLDHVNLFSQKNFCADPKKNPDWLTYTWKREERIDHWKMITETLGGLLEQLKATRVGVKNLKSSHSENKKAQKIIGLSLSDLDKKIISQINHYIHETNRRLIALTGSMAAEWMKEFKIWEEKLRAVIIALDILKNVQPGGRLEFYDDGSVQISIGSSEGFLKGFQSFSRNLKSYTSGAKISGNDAADYIKKHIRELSSLIQEFQEKNFLNNTDKKTDWQISTWSHKEKSTSWLVITRTLGELIGVLSAASIGLENLKNSHSDNVKAHKNIQKGISVIKNKVIPKINEYLLRAESELEGFKEVTTEEIEVKLDGVAVESEVESWGP